MTITHHIIIILNNSKLYDSICSGPHFKTENAEICDTYVYFDYYRFMRSVAYREFIHLVYDRVGKNRIPLPVCAYHSIRKKFQAKDGEKFTGFQEDENDDTQTTQ